MEDTMKKINLSVWIAALAGLVLFLQPGTAHANGINTTFTVSVDTTSLKNHGPFELVLVLTGGSTTNDTTIGINNFAFGSGGSGGSVQGTIGGSSGSLTSGVSLFDSVFFNEFGANFTPGGQLSFGVSIVSTSIDSPTPDLFEFAILNSFGAVSTTDPSGQNTLITVDLDSGKPTVERYAIVTPEPGSILLLTTGFLMALLARLRNGRGCETQ
jgi:hypothetical protein